MGIAPKQFRKMLICDLLVSVKIDGSLLLLLLDKLGPLPLAPLDSRDYVAPFHFLGLFF